MSTYTYTYTQSNFINTTKVDIDYFQILIAGSAMTVPSNGVSMSVSGANFTVRITFNSALTSGNLAILNNLVQTYVYTDINNIMCIIKDIKSQGTNGGTFDNNIWIQRNLNTIVENSSFATLNSNVIRLTEGNYMININAPACDVTNHQVRLKNITENSYSYGSNEYSSGGLMTNSSLAVFVKLLTTTNFEIQHICAKNRSNFGFGKAIGFNTNEVYTSVSIRRV